MNTIYNMISNENAIECLTIDQAIKDNLIDVYDLYYYYPSMAWARLIQSTFIIITILFIIKIVHNKYKNIKVNNSLIISCIFLIIITILSFILKVHK